MGSRFFGNRPDCAYYLLLGLCGAAVFTAFGGIFTYMGYWPQVAFHHPYSTHNYLSHAPNANYYNYEASDSSIQVYTIIGPLLIIIGIGIAITVGVLAIKYDCEYEPEEPKVAIMRLASEMSLNLSPAEAKYELMRTQKRSESTPSTSTSAHEGPVSQNLNQHSHHLV